MQNSVLDFLEKDNHLSPFRVRVKNSGGCCSVIPSCVASPFVQAAFLEGSGHAWKWTSTEQEGILNSLWGHQKHSSNSQAANWLIGFQVMQNIKIRWCFPQTDNQICVCTHIGTCTHTFGKINIYHPQGRKDCWKQKHLFTFPFLKVISFTKVELKKTLQWVNHLQNM